MGGARDETPLPAARMPTAFYNRETTVVGPAGSPTRTSSTCPTGSCSSSASTETSPFGSATSSCSPTGTSTTSATALVIRELRFRDRAGQGPRLRSRRFVSMHRMHQAGIAWELHARELVRQGRGAVGARRPGTEPGRRSATGSSRAGILDSAGATHLRLRRDCSEGAHPSVQDRAGRGRAHARLPRGRGSSRSRARRPYQDGRTTSTSSWRSTWTRAPARASRRWPPSSPRATARSPSRSRMRRRAVAASSDVSDEASRRPRARVGRALGGLRPAALGRASASSFCCASTPRISSRSARGSRPTTTRAFPPAA